VPFICRWPGKIKAGSTSAQLVCLTDLMATCAELTGAKLPDTAGEDSVSILPALLGTDKGPLREAAVHHSINGLFALRQGPWKLELCPGSGGWCEPRDPAALKQGLPLVQLYNMEQGVDEQKNLQAEQPEVIERLTRLLEKYVAEGRSTPGAPQPNDAAVVIRKPLGPARKK
jgi:arylsulfatase A-like enzyme